jgi:hypothetical protein
MGVEPAHTSRSLRSGGRTASARSEISASTDQAGRRRADPAAPLTGDDGLLGLQRAIGNRAVSGLVAGGAPAVKAPGRPARAVAEITRSQGRAVQAKLMVGPASDAHEREADRVAAAVMSTTVPDPAPAGGSAAGDGAVQRRTAQAGPRQGVRPIRTVQRQAIDESVVAALVSPEDERLLASEIEKDQDEDEGVEDADEHGAEPTVQAKRPVRGGEGFEAGAGVARSIEVERARGGSPLPETVRRFMEPRFGVDFSQVRVHADAQADELSRSIGARAFTSGRDIFFRKGELAPGGRRGAELLAHELTHVVQQSGASVAVPHGHDQEVPEHGSEVEPVAKVAPVTGASPLQRSVGLEIEVPIPLDQLTRAQLLEVQQRATGRGPNPADPPWPRWRVDGFLQEAHKASGLVYGPVTPRWDRFEVQADHDDRVDSHDLNYPREASHTMMEIVMNPPASTADEIDQAMDGIDTFIKSIMTKTQNLTRHAMWALPGPQGRVNVGPIDYVDVGLPAVRSPAHNLEGSVQVNIGIDLREYHSMLKWYAGSKYAPERTGEPGGVIETQQEDILKAVDIGRELTVRYKRGLSRSMLAKMGNLRGIRGWITHMALYILRGRYLDGVANSPKSITPILMKSRNVYLLLSGLTDDEIEWYQKNRYVAIYDIMQKSGRTDRPASGTQTFNLGGAKNRKINWTLDDLSDPNLEKIAMAEKFIDPTDVGPERGGSRELRAISSAPSVPGMAPGTPGAGGPGTRLGAVAEFRSLPGYYTGVDSWRAVAKKFLKEADARNRRSGR